MSYRSRIPWTQATWNPVRGCTPVSEGCRHCYARRLAETRLRWKFPNGFGEVQCLRDRLDQPLRWMKPRLIFVCSMGDLFHEDVDPRFLREVLATMRQAPQHTFQVLTKRPNQIEGLLATGDLNPERWPRNAWLGVTVENDKARERIPVLSRVAETLKAPVRFISAEPLLENLNLSGYVNYVDWLIVGGETGPEARPMQVQWARELRGQMRGIQRAFFFKGWGSHIPAGQEKGKLDGMEVHEYPA